MILISECLISSPADEGSINELMVSWTGGAVSTNLTVTIDWGDAVIEVNPVSYGTWAGTGEVYTVNYPHAYDGYGTFAITVTVSDGIDSAIDNKSITINNVVPVITLAEATLDNGSGHIDLSLSFTNVVGSANTVTVTWGDGSITPTTLYPGTHTISYDYDNTTNASKRYLINIRVKDESDDEDTAAIYAVITYDDDVYGFTSNDQQADGKIIYNDVVYDTTVSFGSVRIYNINGSDASGQCSDEQSCSARLSYVFVSLVMNTKCKDTGVAFEQLIERP